MTVAVQLEFNDSKISTWTKRKKTTKIPTDVVGEVLLQLSNCLAPVGCSLLTDELNVEEGALTRSIDVP